MSQGWPLEEAAEAAGIPIEEARDWAKDNLKQSDDTDIQLKLAAQNSLKAALDKLSQVMAEGPRESCAELPLMNTDLDAAKTLARISLDAIKLCKTTATQKGDGPPGGGDPDLFDLQGVYGYWKLKDPNEI